ncbi:hypothetical protein HM1_1264 [Heliomicrobium modesticaldum Ice1]|uniref:6-hydroxymethylpterin diphosphokinase MptE-like domain-containing protein n=1 Tax=Heliobacterium modesticaldum (strain ATCC 51547 / Ice1) TaxID=498761 RepID=B0TGY8_HELMI|nr:6-hydroxymethylpterin diphosphokinase MptE-like protein [Heliomicrobium modesticaldum]ABZ83313.1 hypothetical protein HM1_1264 [Heliomicrobium modesticaldum Ice1]
MQRRLPPYVQYLSDEIFAGNIQALATVQPPLAERMARYKPPYNQPFQVEPAQSGDLTLLVDTGRERLFLLSPVDPCKQAREWVAEVAGAPSSLLVVFGFGLGYTIEVLRQIIPSQGKMVVFERSIDLFWLALWTVDLRHVLADSRIRFAIDVDAASVGPIMHRLNLSASDALTAQLYEFHYLTALFDGYYDQVKGALQEYFQTQQIAVATENYFSLTWTLNFLQNLPAVLSACPVQHLYGRFPALPAVVIAAGPSLEKNLEGLREFARYGLLIATAPTLRVLQQRGIRPHLLLSIDGGAPNYSHFQGLAVDDVPLVFDATLYPPILKAYGGGGKRFALLAYDKAELYGILDGAVDVAAASVNVGASVANLGLVLAYRSGCDPIVFVGQDLAFTGNHSHISGSAFDSAVDEAGMSRYIEMDDIYGQKTYTQETWLAFREWFRWFIKGHPDRRYINATEGGIGIPGTEVATLAAVIGQLRETKASQGRNASDQAIAAAFLQGVQAASQGAAQRDAQIVKKLKNLHGHLRRILEGCEKGQELIAKYQRFVTSRVDIDKPFAQYYRKLDKIRRQIEGDHEAMGFLRLAFRPIVNQLEQSAILADVTDKREALAHDLMRGQLFFIEVGRRSGAILAQVERTMAVLQSPDRGS